MTELMYSELLRQFCDLIGLEDPQRLISTGGLEVDGLLVSLAFRPQVDDRVLNVSVNLGTAAPWRERDVYRALLELNAVSSRSNLGQFSIDGDDGHVIFDARMPLQDDLTGADLARAIDHVVDQARFAQGVMAPA